MWTRYDTSHYLPGTHKNLNSLMNLVKLNHSSFCNVRPWGSVYIMIFPSFFFFAFCPPLSYMSVCLSHQRGTFKTEKFASSSEKFIFTLLSMKILDSPPQVEAKYFAFTERSLFTHKPTAMRDFTSMFINHKKYQEKPNAGARTCCFSCCWCGYEVFMGEISRARNFAVEPARLGQNNT